MGSSLSEQGLQRPFSDKGMGGIVAHETSVWVFWCRKGMPALEGLLPSGGAGFSPVSEHCYTQTHFTPYPYGEKGDY